MRQWSEALCAGGGDIWSAYLERAGSRDLLDATIVEGDRVEVAPRWFGEDPMDELGPLVGETGVVLMVCMEGVVVDFGGAQRTIHSRRLRRL